MPRTSRARSSGSRARAPAPEPVEPEGEELDQGGDGGEYDENEGDYLDDPDLAGMNDDRVTHLGEAPVIHRRNDAEMYGNHAGTVGRSSSPPLFAQASGFPTARQLRVWRVENGTPAGLGVIYAQASEDDFVRQFFHAMPKPGMGTFVFLARPVDMRGKELGSEIEIPISEHHTMLKQLRDQAAAEAAGAPPGAPWAGGTFHVGDPADPAGPAYIDEMGRMMDTMQQTAEQQRQHLQDQLERDREELRTMERQRAEERVAQAERAGGIVEKLTERMMATDRQRGEELREAQERQQGVVLSSLTTVFHQQQEAARADAERQRETEARRAEQDRAFYERQRMDAEQQRLREREEAERKRALDHAEWERKQTEIKEEAARRTEEMRIETQRRTEELKIEAQRRADELRAETERKLAQEKAELEVRRAQISEDRLRYQAELEERRRADREEAERRARLETDRIEREKRDLEERRRADREEADRREKLERDRMERERLEIQSRLEREKLEFDRKEAQRREELAREAEQRREDLAREKMEFERRENQRREDIAREEAKRREEAAIQLKQMEMAAQRDREHAERMLTLAKIEHDGQREAALAREKLEHAAREAAEHERQRQHLVTMEEMRLTKERDREHSERMIQLQKDKNSGGLSGLQDLVGMDTPELLTRIFGGGEEGGEGSGGWVDAIPKVLGALAEMGKVAVAAQQGTKPEKSSKPPRVGGANPAQIGAPMSGMVPLHGPDGTVIGMVPASAVQQQAPPPQPVAPAPAAPPKRARKPAPVPTPAPPIDQLTTPPIVTPVPVEGQPTPETEGVEQKLRAGSLVSTLKRANAAQIPIAPQQRDARRQIKDLVRTLDRTDETEWAGLVAAALAKNPGLFAYLKAVTVYAALAEAKTPVALAGRIVQALQGSGMAPPDTLPYDEADLERMILAEASSVLNETAVEVAPVPVETPAVKAPTNVVN